MELIALLIMGGITALVLYVVILRRSSPHTEPLDAKGPTDEPRQNTAKEGTPRRRRRPF